MKFFDPRGRPTITAGGDHYFRTCCLYVRPHFSKSRRTKTCKVQERIGIGSGGTVGLVEWIIDNTPVFLSLFMPAYYTVIVQKYNAYEQN